MAQSEIPPLTIKAIIFDCDGTLVDSEHAHYLSWRYAFQQQGHDLDFDFYRKHFVGNGHYKNLGTARELLGVECLEQLSADKEHHFSQLQQAGISPIEWTVSFLWSLIEQRDVHDLKFAVASGARKAEISRNLDAVGVEECFEVVLSGHEDLAEYDDPEGTNKPKPYIYLKAAKMLGVRPEECLVIEDSAPGISAAVAAGCITVAIPNSFTGDQDLSHADLRLQSLEGISLDALMKQIAHSRSTS